MQPFERPSAALLRRHPQLFRAHEHLLKKLSAAQLKWSTGDRELFTLYSAVKRFRHLLEGQQHLQLCTDHKPLTGTEEPHTLFALELHRTFAQLSPKETASGRPVFVSPSLLSATHVFVWVGSHRPPLQPLYKGLYRVVERGPKSYLLEPDGGVYSASFDRLKPAFLLAAQREASQLSPDDQPVELAFDAQHSSSSLATTRSGRVPRPPAR
ncbi:hypothetical protein M513_10829 [Trichuris suis]|uniref:Reverse transcriptase RNase H-like domain-containing protein n=1 Tax=Trichuris suis TaxID=68888 RepID=A0A085LTP1_9BILA|nr:hypothetical protein M513_10829 [Trichuris suis]